ncbi:MAG: heparinase II/III family protein [Micrococcales bacterium]|nr:heparinase II/III family protein [Micrococcales bacterium]
MRSRPLTVVLPVAALTAVTLMAAPLASAATLATPPVASASTTAVRIGALASDRYPCRGYGAFDVANTPAKVTANTFTWEYGTAKVGDGRNNINWKADPYQKPSWRTWFHALYWTGSLIKKSTQGITKDRDPKAIDTAVAIAQDWVGDNPFPWPTGPGPGNATMTRTDHLLCLRGALEKMGKPVPRWLDTSLIQHAQWLKSNIWPDHNVGTDQLIAMLGVGCVLGRADIRTDAANQLAQRIGRVIDAQGANNEQAVGYARWNYELWGAAQRAMESCAVNSTAMKTIASRRAAAMRFLDQATAPDGTLALLGDTQALRLDPAKSPAQAWIRSNGTAGAPAQARVAIYAAGYVFGRSGWGSATRRPSQESFYTLRYGPKRVGHGHNDHTSLTWATRGRNILVDPGVGEYVNDAWRDFYTGTTAHNQMATPQMKTSPATRLVKSSLSAKADSFRFADTPYKGAARMRDVIVLSDPDIVVTFDRIKAPKATTFTQYWHLPRDQALRVRGTKATARKAGEATVTTLLGLPVGATAPTAFGAARGSRKPVQGWVWVDPFHRYPAPVATVTRKGTAATIATAVVVGPGNAPVSVSTKVSGATTTYTFGVGGRSATVSLAGDGTLRRGR